MTHTRQLSEVGTQHTQSRSHSESGTIPERMFSALEPRIEELFTEVGRILSMAQSEAEPSDPPNSELDLALRTMNREVKKSVSRAMEEHSKQRCWEGRFVDKSKVEFERDGTSIRFEVTPACTFVVNLNPESTRNVTSCREITLVGDKVTILGIRKNTAPDDDAGTEHWKWCIQEPSDDFNASVETKARSSRRGRVIAGVKKGFERAFCMK
jgi:hypothetical protein